MPEAAHRWGTFAILGAGMALRIVLTIVLPPRCANDDHYPPIKIIANERRLPRAEECWECCQPPLYYAVAAAAYGTSEQIAAKFGALPAGQESAARKTVQFISTAAGCATLVVCLLILRQSGTCSQFGEALPLGCVAVLPQHIYMSAMATNDALTYLLASLAILLAIRARGAGWPARGCLFTGAMAGATVLCKGYGLVTAFAILGVGSASILWGPAIASLQTVGVGPRRRARQTNLGRVGLLWGACAAVGVWPTVRNLALYRTVHLDNFRLFQTPMTTQPPGSTAGTDYFSFRLFALLRHPWLHLSHVNSFWTEIYARYWFDYEGLPVTLRLSPEWLRHTKSLQLARGIQRTPEEWIRILQWDGDDVPASLRVTAVISYLAGLPITGLILYGAVLALRRRGGDFVGSLLLVHLAGCLFVPLFQVLRAPHFSAMKSAFTLSAISSVPVMAAWAIRRFGPRLAKASDATLGVALLSLVACQFVFIAWIHAHAR